MGLCRCFVYVLCVFFILAYYPSLPPRANFEYLDLPAVPPATGSLAKNNFLDFGERLFENYLIGPESIAVAPNDEIYVGVHNGNIVKIWGKNFEHSKVIGNNGPPQCSNAEPHEESTCGRPLGLRYLSSGHILIADAYFGILKMDVTTGKSEMIVNASLPINGLKPLLTDDLDIDNNGNIYWSDASTTTNLENAVLDMLSGASGRLLKTNLKTRKTEVLLDHVHFANGVQLSPKQDFVLLNVCFARRVLRYWLKGPKAGTHDVFVDELPGMPDNIRARPDGGYYVSLVAPYDRNAVDFYAMSGKAPAFRRLVIRLTYYFQCMVDFAAKVYPHPSLHHLSYKILNLAVFSSLMDTKLSMVVEVDENGKIFSSLQGYEGRLQGISETQRVGDSLLFGSPWSPYLGRLKLSDLGKMQKTHSQKSTKTPLKEEL